MGTTRGIGFCTPLAGGRTGGRSCLRQCRRYLGGAKYIGYLVITLSGSVICENVVLNVCTRSSHGKPKRTLLPRLRFSLGLGFVVGRF